mmetsp:Transcript_29484/g.56621  ORF Transcript_29484/g.56621 Transcript_29484/m.56621 type:complete len:337 (+) Transcript_29484:132-1142(+)
MSGGAAGSGSNFVIGHSGVKYGLTLNPKKKKTKIATKVAPALSVFADAEADADAESEDFRGAAQLAREQAKYSMSDSKVQAQHAAALAEDPNVFSYDDVIDTIKESKQDVKQSEKLERQSRYISTLMKRAKDREREQNVIYERQLLKDRKKEDHLYGDKDRFVTAAYKKKLQEDAQWLEEEKMREALEEQNDVTKKKDMSGMFYNLLKTNSRYGAQPSTAADEQPVPSDDEPVSHSAKTSRSQASGGGEGEQSTLAKSNKVKAAPQEDMESTSIEGPLPDSAAVSSPPVPTVNSTPQGATSTSSILEAANPQPERRTKEDAVKSARERYLARKRKI